METNKFIKNRYRQAVLLTLGLVPLFGGCGPVDTNANEDYIGGDEEVVQKNDLEEATATNPGNIDVAIVSYSHPIVRGSAQTAPSKESRQRMAFIPRGAGGVHYQGDSPGIEMLPQGPAAMVVDDAGTFWVLDTVAGHILHLSASGELISDLDKSADLIHGSAIAVARDQMSKDARVAVFDLGANAPRVYQYDANGRALTQTQLPVEWLGSVHRIALYGDGNFDVDVVAGKAGRYHVALGREGQGTITGISDLPYWGPENGPDLHWLAGRMRTVDPDNKVMEKQLLGSAPDGDMIFRVGEFSGDQEGNIYVDITVQRYGSDGTFRGMARVPAREQHVFVENDGLAVDPRTGDVLVLLTHSDGASIERLEMVEALDVLPPMERPRSESKNGVSQKQSEQANLLSRSTCTIIGVANNYCSTVWVPASAVPNDSTTTGRTAPSYMSTAGGSYVVPYAYNGFDNQPNFASHMASATSANHYKAGDVDTNTQIWYSGTGVSSWSGKPFFGVDCSGFVSRAWGLASKYSTTGLVNSANGIVVPYCPATFQQGDIMNLAGTHTRMYIDGASSPSWNGYYRYEESAGNPYGVQINTYTLSSQLAKGYVQYRRSDTTAYASCAIVTYCPH